MKQLLQSFTPKVCWQQNCKKLCNIRSKFNNRPNKEPNSSSSDHSRGGNWFKTWNLVLTLRIHSPACRSLLWVGSGCRCWPAFTIKLKHFFAFFLWEVGRAPACLPWPGPPCFLLRRSTLRPLGRRTRRSRSLRRPPPRRRRPGRDRPPTREKKSNKKFRGLCATVYNARKSGGYESFRNTMEGTSFANQKLFSYPAKGNETTIGRVILWRPAIQNI